MNRSVSRIFGGILLIAGTAIGAGILALPVTTGLMGFFPSVLLFFLYWAVMTYTALLFLEINLWFNEERVNLITMAKETLGKGGEALSWLLYLFLLYSLTTAYLAVASPLFSGLMEMLFGVALPSWMGPLPLIVIFGFFVYEGAFYVDWVNRLLMTLLLLSFVVLIGGLLPEIDWSHFEHVNMSFLPMTLALAATSFGYHIVIPTLTRYLHRDVKGLVKVILIGGTIPLIVTLLWEFVTVGTIPLGGEHGLINGYVEGRDAVQLIASHLEAKWVASVAKLFLFAAVVTSFLGVTISLRDFLADGFHIQQNLLGRAKLYLMTFIPPLFFALTFPRAFFNALDYAGVVGVILLLVVMPICMVYRGRYQLGKDSSLFQAPGGKGALALGLILSLIVIFSEVMNKTGLL